MWSNREVALLGVLSAGAAAGIMLGALRGAAARSALATARAAERHAAIVQGLTATIGKSKQRHAQAAARASAGEAVTGPAAGPAAGYHCDVLGVVKSCFKQRFGIPRQPGLAPLAVAELELKSPWNHPEAVRGLSGWSHIWVTFIFHETPVAKRFKATVHPPRGDQKYGVFATRTTHRPNRIGLSLCKVLEVRAGGRDRGTSIKLEGVDLLDGTPVIDIRPYLPYTEAISDATAGFAPEPPRTVGVKFTPDAEQQLADLRSKHPQIRELADQVLSQDPRPTFRKRRTDLDDADKEFCQYLCDVKFRWKHSETSDGKEWITVLECSKLSRADTASLFL